MSCLRELVIGPPDRGTSPSVLIGSQRPLSQEGLFSAAAIILSQFLERMRGEHFPEGDFLFSLCGFLYGIIFISYSTYLG